MDKKVRRAVIGDVVKIMPLLTSVDKFHIDNRKDVFHDAGFLYSEYEIKTAIEEDNGLYIFVSTSEINEITGVLLCYFDEIQDSSIFLDSKKLWIDNNCVGKPYRKEGYGKMLLDYAKTFAKENGCSSIELIVWDFNKNAHDFYKSQGMTEKHYTMEYIL